MRNINIYKHLSKDDKVSYSIKDNVQIIENLNYGSQRFLSELVLLRESSEEYQKYESFREHTQQLRDLLEGGWF